LRALASIRLGRTPEHCAIFVKHLLDFVDAQAKYYTTCKQHMAELERNLQ
uniref:Ferritin n=1 Tax=Globodera pallida TaxID=36090 RepID=A0A183CT06_GLOPA